MLNYTKHRAGDWFDCKQHCMDCHKPLGLTTPLAPGMPVFEQHGAFRTSFTVGVEYESIGCIEHTGTVQAAVDGIEESPEQRLTAVETFFGTGYIDLYEVVAILPKSAPEGEPERCRIMLDGRTHPIDVLCSVDDMRRAIGDLPPEPVVIKTGSMDIQRDQCVVVFDGADGDGQKHVKSWKVKTVQEVANSDPPVCCIHEQGGLYIWVMGSRTYVTTRLGFEE